VSFGSGEQCDGVRPKCGLCVAKDRPCGFEGEAGQSRQAAMKSRLAQLEKLFGTLQSRSPEKAERLLQQIRSADDLASVLNGEEGGDSDSPAPTLSNVSAADDATSVSLSFSTVANSTCSSSVLSRHTGDSRHVSNADSRSGPCSSTSPVSSRGSSTRMQIADTAAFLVSLVMPNAAVTQRAVDSFFTSAGKLFHVFSKEQVDRSLEDVFGPKRMTAGNQRSAVCCLASVAAVGVQYNTDGFGEGLDETFYDVARHYFVDVIEHRPLDAIKVCTLLAQYNIMNKATVSVAYIGKFFLGWLGQGSGVAHPCCLWG
jgi:hypothetical protein